MFLILVCSVFIVSADHGNDFDEDDEVEIEDEIEENPVRAEVKIREKERNRFEIKSGDVSAETEGDLEIYEEEIGGKNELRVRLSNGRNAEVKIMPDVASERALERLKLRVCSEENNCKIELKEVGKDEESEVAYEVEVEKESRVFGIFKAGMKVRAQVSAENGEVVGYPWNPNGSAKNIAGICDATGRILGLMPHPERYLSRYNHPRWTREKLPEEGDGLAIFRNAVRYAEGH